MSDEQATPYILESKDNDATPDPIYSKDAHPLTTNDTPQPTSAALWKKRTLQTVELPSGAWATLRPVNLAVCLLQGDVPSTLLALVKDVVSDGTASAMNSLKSVEDVKRGVKFMNFMIENCMVAPQVWNGKESECPADQINHSDLIEEDRNFIVAYAQSPVVAMARFREQRRGAAARPDGDAVRTAAQ